MTLADGGESRGPRDEQQGVDRPGAAGASRPCRAARARGVRTLPAGATAGPRSGSSVGGTRGLVHGRPRRGARRRRDRRPGSPARPRRVGGAARWPETDARGTAGPRCCAAIRWHPDLRGCRSVGRRTPTSRASVATARAARVGRRGVAAGPATTPRPRRVGLTPTDLHRPPEHPRPESPGPTSRRHPPSPQPGHRPCARGPRSPRQPPSRATATSAPTDAQSAPVPPVRPPVPPVPPGPSEKPHPAAPAPPPAPVADDLAVVVPRDVDSTWAARPVLEPDAATSAPQAPSTDLTARPAGPTTHVVRDDVHEADDGELPPPPSYDYLFGHTTTADEHRKALAQLTRPTTRTAGPTRTTVSRCPPSPTCPTCRSRTPHPPPRSRRDPSSSRAPGARGRRAVRGWPHLVRPVGQPCAESAAARPASRRCRPSPDGTPRPPPRACSPR